MQNRAKVTIIYCCLLVLLLSSSFTDSLSGQESFSVDRVNVGRVRAIIYRFDPQAGVRTGTSGWIVEVRDSTLLFDNGDELSWLESSSVDRVDLFTLPSSDLPVVLFTASTWLTAHLLASSHDINSDEGYQDQSLMFSRYPVQDLVFGSLTVGLATHLTTYLITRDWDERREIFHLDSTDRSTEWKRLQARMQTRRPRLSVQFIAAGQIWREGESAIEQRQREGGLGYVRVIPTGQGKNLPYQWPRRIRLGYSLSPVVDVGFIVVSHGFPSIVGNFGIPHFPYDGKNWDVETSAAAIGYAPSVVVRPYGWSAGPEAGVALGFADVGFHERTTGPDSVTRDLVTESVEARSLLPMILINADFSVKIRERLVFNATVDLCLLPDFTPPPRRGGWPSEPVPIPLGSASIGVGLGYRF